MNRERIEDLAVLYSSGELGRDDLAEFKAWRGGASAQELAWFSAIVDDVGELELGGFEAVTPPDEVKSKLLGQLGLDGKPAMPGFEFLTAYDAAVQWEELPFKGARVRRLSDHSEDGATVFILELDPDTRFPSHGHNGSECAYVLEGDLEIEGRFLRAGDFSRAAPGTHHRDLFSRDGCRALIITSRDNFPRKRMDLYSGLRRIAGRIGAAIGVGKN